MRRLKLKQETRELVPLMGELARLTSPRSDRESRGTGLGLAYRKLSYYAERNQLPVEEFCDGAMMILLETQPRAKAA